MGFKIGDKVRFLNETGEGIIKQFNNKKMAIVEIEDAFEIPVLVSQLVKIEEQEPETFTKIKPLWTGDVKGVKRIILEKELSDSIKKVSKKHTKHNEISEEVDLHIEQLTDSHRGMSNGEIIVIQLNYFRTRLDKAIEHNIQKIVFIHGVGNGVLKSEIIRILNGYPGISFHDASYKRYGYGATEVVIK